MAALERHTIGVSEEAKLGFAKVYEDPTFELAAIDAAGGVVLGPSSGGDTALSFLAAGATDRSADLAPLYVRASEAELGLGAKRSQGEQP